MCLGVLSNAVQNAIAGEYLKTYSGAIVRDVLWTIRGLWFQGIEMQT